MYKIHPVENDEVARIIYPALTEGELLFVVNEEGSFTGEAVCVISGDTVRLKHLRAPFDDARTLLFLAVLNYAERRGITRAVCEAPDLKDLCRRMDFDDDMTVSLVDFFVAGRHCSHEI